MDLIAGQTLRKRDGSMLKSEDALANKTLVSFLFSAHWCPPCRQFTNILKEFYEEVQGQGLEVIFVSSDRSADDMATYMKSSHGDWLAIEHSSEVAKALKHRFAISGIPSLVVVRKDGKLVTKEGRTDIQGKGPMAIKDWM